VKYTADGLGKDNNNQGEKKNSQETTHSKKGGISGRTMCTHGRKEGSIQHAIALEGQVRVGLRAFAPPRGEE